MSLVSSVRMKFIQNLRNLFEKGMEPFITLWRAARLARTVDNPGYPVSTSKTKIRLGRRPVQFSIPWIATVADIARAKNRIEVYMDTISAPQLYRDRYRNAISAVQRRPLEAGRGIHSWVSMKEKLDGKRSNTFYLSAELYGCLVDDGLSNGGH